MPLPITKTSEEEALHREMERISLDWVMIQNPTEEDFYIDWLPWHYLVPHKDKDIGWGPGKLETQRYLAVWYCKHMKDKLVNEKGHKEYARMIAEREQKGLPTLTKYEEQKAIWEKTPRTTSDKELVTLYPMLFLGVTREFGMDYTEEKPYEVNLKTAEEQVMEKMQSKKYTSTDKPAMQSKRPPVKGSAALPSVEDLEALMPHTSKEQLAKEISA